jgi:cyclic beta-1,2-glucan synthetase
LCRAIEETAWDGRWYRRAYFADGTPLGSSESPQCRIDAIAQSWAAISGMAEPARAEMALDSAEAELVHEKAGFMALLAPPFTQRGEHDPGYIAAYPTGIRENGGQYTHGVLWSVLARTELGHGERAEALFRLMNPIHHAETLEDVARYVVEPYVVAADVYAHPDHMGRGGWTWYTGSAAWMYRIGIENILGVRLDGGKLVVSPCIPPAWKSYEIEYRHRSARYRISVENPYHVARGVVRVDLDGTLLPDGHIPLEDDGRVHRVRVTLGEARRPLSSEPGHRRTASGGV